MGFSSFSLATGTISLNLELFKRFQGQQVTLVDCPGHASLIKTIICGSQIIDAALLIVDTQKGIQAQTLECIMITELLAPYLIIVLNKVDLLGDAKDEKLSALEQQVRNLLKKTSVTVIAIIPFSTVENTENYCNALKATLCDALSLISVIRSSQVGALLASDHCFSVKGKGTVLTGTVLQGLLSIGNEIEINFGHSFVKKKIKGIQSFKRSVPTANAGDRVAILVNDLNPEGIQRTLISAPGLVKSSSRILVELQRIPYYKEKLQSGSKIHVTVLNQTAIATVRFYSDDHELLDGLENSSNALLEFERSMSFLEGIKILGARLDIKPSAKKCRFAFHGNIVSVAPPKLSLYQPRVKSAFIDRITSPREIIARDLIKKDGILSPFIGKTVQLLSSDRQVIAQGTIVAPFGASGKVKVGFKFPIAEFEKPVTLSEYSLQLNYQKWFDV